MIMYTYHTAHSQGGKGLACRGRAVGVREGDMIVWGRMDDGGWIGAERGSVDRARSGNGGEDGGRQRGRGGVGLVRDNL